MSRKRKFYLSRVSSQVKRQRALRAAASPAELHRRREIEAKRLAAKRAAESPAETQQRREIEAKRLAAKRAAESRAQIRKKRDEQTLLLLLGSTGAEHWVKASKEIIIHNENPEKRCEIEHEDLHENHYSSSSITIKSEESIFSCPKCEFVFVQKEHLDDHISNLHVKKGSKMSFEEVFVTEHPLVEINPNLEAKPHVCEICLKVLDQISNLKDHICSKNVFTKNELSVDLQKAEKTFSCPLCDKSFTSTDSLERHKIFHSGENSYKCEVCKMKFSNSKHLKCHKLIHTGEKPHECHICKREFTDLAHLRRHKRRHTGEKPHKCEVCIQKYSAVFSFSSS